MSVSVQLVNGAFVWRSGLQIDADGAPKAYHPDSKPGLDFLANAGKDGNWWGLACNDHGIPYIQSSTDPAPGFYVSTTSLADKSKGARNPLRYVDSSTVPYITTTRDMQTHGCKLGDLAMVCYGTVQCAAIVADVGPHPGEGSIALAQKLGIPSDPRHGGTSHPAVSFVIFKGSARGWPRTDVADKAEALFKTWGGLAKLALSLPGDAH